MMKSDLRLSFNGPLANMFDISNKMHIALQTMQKDHEMCFHP